jgi:hypothetical protein
MNTTVIAEAKATNATVRINRTAQGGIFVRTTCGCSKVLCQGMLCHTEQEARSEANQMWSLLKTRQMWCGCAGSRA